MIGSTMRILFAFVLLCLATTAPAHEMWIERAADGTRAARFGEPDEGVVEQFGSRYYAGVDPLFFGRNRRAAMHGVRERDRFTVPAAAGDGDVRMIEQAEAPFAAWPDRPGDILRRIFYAREGLRETRPAMAFEWVPLRAGSNRFVLVRDGRPLANHEVTLVDPQDRRRVLRTDRRGRLTAPLPGAGRHILSAAVMHPVDGVTPDGRPYTIGRWVTTLTVHR